MVGYSVLGVSGWVLGVSGRVRGYGGVCGRVGGFRGVGGVYWGYRCLWEGTRVVVGVGALVGVGGNECGSGVWA